MVEHLRLRWRDDLSMEALLGLCDELDDMLGRIPTTIIVESSWPRARMRSVVVDTGSTPVESLACAPCPDDIRCVPPSSVAEQ